MEQLKQLIIPVGMPGCGKTTYYNDNESSLMARVSPDDIREKLCGDPSDQSRNKEVFEMAHAQLRELLRPHRIEGENYVMLDYIWVYFDATNLTESSRFELHKIAQEAGVSVQVRFFDVKPDVCRERNAARGRVVPEDVMNKMACRFYQTAQTLLFEGFDYITVVRG